jgi:hypothetical protein
LLGRSELALEAVDQVEHLAGFPVAVARVRPEDVVALVASLSRAGKSPKTIRNALGVLHGVGHQHAPLPPNRREVVEEAAPACHRPTQAPPQMKSEPVPYERL